MDHRPSGILTHQSISSTWRHSHRNLHSRAASSKSLAIFRSSCYYPRVSITSNMSVAWLFSVECGAFSLLLILSLGRQLMLHGFISAKHQHGFWGSIEGLALLSATLTVGIQYSMECLNERRSDQLPGITTPWLVTYGCACVIYLVAKIVRSVRPKGI
jgi:hypothetical protein